MEKYKAKPEQKSQKREMRPDTKGKRNRSCGKNMDGKQKGCKQLC